MSKHPHYNLIILSVILLFVEMSPINAQPGVEWSHTYSVTDYQHFRDVYPNEDGSYIMVGGLGRGDAEDRHAYMVKVDEEGELEWDIDFELGDSGLESVIELDNGDYATCGRYNDSLLVMRIADDGDVVWFEAYDIGWGYSIIELKNDDLAVAGWTHDGHEGFVVRLEADDGDLVWLTENDDHYSSTYYDMRESGDYLYVGGNCMAERYGQRDFLFAKYDQEDGEEIWNSTYNHSGGHDAAVCMSSHPDGFVLSGDYDRQNTPYRSLTVLLDSDGDEIWYTVGQRDNFSLSWRDVRTLDNGYIVQVGNGQSAAGYSPVWNILNRSGIEVYFDTYYLDDEAHPQGGHFYGAAQAQDGGIVAVGSLSSQENITYAWLLRLSPVDVTLRWLRTSPSDSTLRDSTYKVLVNEEVTFSAIAEDGLDRDVDYYWQLNGGDTLSNDTTLTLTFDELGLDTVTCVATNETETILQTWVVEVTTMFIESYSPWITQMKIRRGTIVDFSMNVKSIYPDSLSYSWLLVDQFENERSFSDTSRISHEFNVSRIYSLNGACTMGEIYDEIDWSIVVRSAIWGYSPEATDLTYQPGDTAVFEVVPFSWDSDSITCSWLVNNRVVRDSVYMLNWVFQDSGEFEVQVKLADGVERDSVIWNVDVRLLNSVEAQRHVMPVDVVLYPLSPNPFNARTVIKYSLVKNSDVRITLYDALGRRVDVYLDKEMSAGYHDLILDGERLSAGKYLLQMEANGLTLSQSLVLLK